MNHEDKKKDYFNKIKLIKKYNKYYFEKNKPLVSDKDFDDLKITSHIYTQDPSQRAIFIEDQVYRIGDQYKSAEIRAIDQDGFVLRVNHERYIEDVYIPLANNWSTR